MFNAFTNYTVLVLALIVPMFIRNAMNDLEQLDEQLNKGEVQEQQAFRKIRAAISRHFVPAAWLYPELEGSPVAERQQGRGKNNRRRKNQINILIRRTTRRTQQLRMRNKNNKKQKNTKPKNTT